MVKIVCAACKNIHRGEIILGVRHFDKIMHDQIKMANLGRDWIQGFVDNKGNFLTREEALKVATEAKQLIRKTQPEDQLFSEDLY